MASTVTPPPPSHRPCVIHDAVTGRHACFAKDLAAIQPNLVVEQRFKRLIRARAGGGRHFLCYITDADQLASEAAHFWLLVVLAEQVSARVVRATMLIVV